MKPSVEGHNPSGDQHPVCAGNDREAVNAPRGPIPASLTRDEFMYFAPRGVDPWLDAALVFLDEPVECPNCSDAGDYGD